MLKNFWSNGANLDGDDYAAAAAVAVATAATL